MWYLAVISVLFRESLVSSLVSGSLRGSTVSRRGLLSLCLFDHVFPPSATSIAVSVLQFLSYDSLYRSWIGFFR